MNAEKLGNYIVQKRKELDYTQKELGKEIGVSDKAISKWENGLSFPDISNFELLAKALKVDINDLLKHGVISETEATVDTDLSSDEAVKKDALMKLYMNNLNYYKHKRKTRRKIFAVILAIIAVLVLIPTVMLCYPRKGANLLEESGNISVCVVIMSKHDGMPETTVKQYTILKDSFAYQEIHSFFNRNNYHSRFNLKRMLSKDGSYSLKDSYIAQVNLCEGDTALSIFPEDGFIDYTHWEGDDIETTGEFKLGYSGNKEEVKICGDILASIVANDCQPDTVN